MAKSKEDFQIELDQKQKEYDIVGRRMTFLRNKIIKFNTNDDKAFAAGITTTLKEGGLESIAGVQWQWLLTHWHSDTRFAYDFRSGFFANLGVNTNGIAGHAEAEKTKQFKFSIHSHHTPSKFLDLYNIIKDHLISSSSPKDGHQVVSIQLLMNLFGESWEHTSWELEIDPKTNLSRLVKLYERHSQPGDWISLEESFEIINKYTEEY